MPTHDWDLIEDGAYMLFGKTLAHSIMQGGPGIIGLAESVYTYLINENIDMASCKIILNDIPDLDMRDSIKTIIDCPEKDLVKLPINDVIVADLLDQAGVQSINVTNRHKSVQHILVTEIFLKRKNELDEICHGLRSLSLQKFLQQHACLANIVFQCQPDYTTYAQMIINML